MQKCRTERAPALCRQPSAALPSGEPKIARRRSRLAGFFRLDAELLEEREVLIARFRLHVDVSVEYDETAIFEAHERIDFCERQVVAEKDVDQL